MHTTLVMVDGDTVLNGSLPTETALKPKYFAILHDSDDLVEGLVHVARQAAG